MQYNSFIDNQKLSVEFANVTIYVISIIEKYKKIAKKDEKLYTALKEMLKIYEGNSKIKVELDFNPINL